jgi:hypothetical protein
MKASLELLTRDNLITPKAAAKSPVSKLHEDFATAIGSPLPEDSLKQFHVLREMRNCLIHRGGIIDDRLVTHASECTKGANKGWRKVVGNSPHVLKEGEPLKIGVGELVMGFAVSKLLARTANRMLVSELSRTTLIDIILEDIKTLGPGIPASADERMRKVAGYTRHHYQAVAATPNELADGLTRMGY